MLRTLMALWGEPALSPALQSRLQPHRETPSSNSKPCSLRPPRAIEDLWRAIGDATGAITPNGMRQLLRGCWLAGYEPK